MGIPQEPVSTPPAAFCTTHWSLVLAAGQPGHPATQKALGALYQSYWYPLYAFVRRKGHPPEEAKDLTQDFFALLLEKNFVGDADRDRGRFRTFLLTACTNFLANDWAKRRTLKRGGGFTFVSLQEESAEDWYQREPVDGVTPEKLFDRRWALSVLARTMNNLRVEFQKAGKSEVFSTLEPFLSGEKHPASYTEAARRLGMSEGTVRVNVHRLRARYGELLRQEIGQTLANPADLEDELRHLLAVLAA